MAPDLSELADPGICSGRDGNGVPGSNEPTFGEPRRSAHAGRNEAMVLAFRDDPAAGSGIIVIVQKSDQSREEAPYPARPGGNIRNRASGLCA